MFYPFSSIVHCRYQLKKCQISNKLKSFISEKGRGVEANARVEVELIRAVEGIFLKDDWLLLLSGRENGITSTLSLRSRRFFELSIIQFFRFYFFPLALAKEDSALISIFPNDHFSRGIVDPCNLAGPIYGNPIFHY